jgi:uncharacterized membrane protein
VAWVEFIAAFLAFFISHSVPVRPAIRARLVERVGSRGFTLGYSALSLAVLAWLIGAAGRAPFVPLWSWAPWQDHFVLAAMGAVCLLLALAIGRPNPYSFGGWRNETFRPARPGIVRVARHPLLLALGIWAFAHMLPNGDLAHAVLFGVFGCFALLGQRIIDRRRRRHMGPSWDRLRCQMQAASFAAAIVIDRGTALRLVLGIVLYGLLLWAHPALFGVNPVK